jgi:hypothetical protein
LASLIFTFDPPGKVAAAMSNNELSHSPLVVDVSGETRSEAPIDKRMTFSLSFNSVRIPRAFGKADCYVACQGAKITFASDRSDIADRASGASIEFTYSKTKGKTRKIMLALEPEVGAEAGPVKASAKGPKAAVEKKKEDSTEFSFTDEENQLSVTTTPRTVSWSISMVRIERAIRDFIFGDLPLWIDFKSNGLPLKGNLTIEPKALRFDNEEKRIQGMAALLMSYAVWNEGVLNDKRSTIRVEELTK